MRNILVASGPSAVKNGFLDERFANAFFTNSSYKLLDALNLKFETAHLVVQDLRALDTVIPFREVFGEVGHLWLADYLPLAEIFGPDMDVDCAPSVHRFRLLGEVSEELSLRSQCGYFHGFNVGYTALQIALTEFTQDVHVTGVDLYCHDTASAPSPAHDQHRDVDVLFAWSLASRSLTFRERVSVDPHSSLAKLSSQSLGLLSSQSPEST